MSSANWKREDLVEPRLVLRVRHGHEHLDAPIEVARHPVGGADQEQRLALVAVGEADDARMLEVATEDRAHADVLAEPGHAGTQAADAADGEVDLHAGVARLVQRLDQLGVAERVQLGRDPALAAEAWPRAR